MDFFRYTLGKNSGEVMTEAKNGEEGSALGGIIWLIVMGICSYWGYMQVHHEDSKELATYVQKTWHKELSRFAKVDVT